MSSISTYMQIIIAIQMALNKTLKWAVKTLAVFVLISILVLIVRSGSKTSCAFQVYKKENLPAEFRDFVPRHDSFSFTQITPTTLLICEQVDFGGYVAHDVQAYLRGSKLCIDLQKRLANNDYEVEGSIFYVVITLPKSMPACDVEISYRSILK